MKRKLLNLHERIFNSNTEKTVFFSPGRVNLIGEHIDYNGGYVMPFAISIGIYGVFSFRNDKEIFVYSDNYRGFGIKHANQSSLDYNKDDGWFNYVKGVILYLKNAGLTIDRGFNLTLFSNLPTGAGLSSSASLEALIAVTLTTMYQFDISREALSVLTKDVENNFVHVNCGIMDQFVILNNEDSSVMLLDTATLKFECFEINMNDYEFVIVDPQIHRGLVSSEYNNRRKECETGLSILKQYYPIDNLCELKPDTLEQIESYLNDPIVYKRVKHAILEQDRVLKAKQALVDEDFAALGQILNEGHISLRDDYEVSIENMDKLVEISIEEGALGSRMTGAGFGGCTINLIKKEDKDAWIENVNNRFKYITGKDLHFYEANPSKSTDIYEGK